MVRRSSLWGNRKMEIHSLEVRTSPSSCPHYFQNAEVGEEQSQSNLPVNASRGSCCCVTGNRTVAVIPFRVSWASSKLEVNAKNIRSEQHDRVKNNFFLSVTTRVCARRCFWLLLVWPYVDLCSASRISFQTPSMPWLALASRTMPLGR
jgi:hypothetical protein